MVQLLGLILYLLMIGTVGVNDQEEIGRAPPNLQTSLGLKNGGVQGLADLECSVLDFAYSCCVLTRSAFRRRSAFLPAFPLGPRGGAVNVGTIKIGCV